MGKIFGTDGARGIANTEISCELAMNIGRAAAVVLTRHTHHKAKIMIGMDTRISSGMLLASLSAGICSVGADAEILGTVPTPAVAYLVKKHNADAGVMISASHNPFEFNGIKLFDSEGYKLSDEIEEEIEDLLLDISESLNKTDIKCGCEIGHIINYDLAAADYIEHILNSIDGDLSGLKIAVDCANGSAASTAELLFQRLGAQVEILNNKPDGININDNCGSTYMRVLSEYVRKNKFDCGVAFDGDADRCLITDENGAVIYGDTMMAILSKSLLTQGKLAKNTLVTTVMSNMGLLKFAEKHGINILQTKVGDRYVIEEMLKGGYILGGEQSGHIIFSDYSTTGDGQLSAVQILALLKKSGKKMSELASLMTVYPQVLIGVEADLDAKKRFEADDEIKAFIKNTEENLNGEGRILVRASGTEPLIRIMAEGRELVRIEEAVTGIRDKIKSRLGI